jgi:hypothetical protein
VRVEALAGPAGFAGFGAEAAAFAGRPGAVGAAAATGARLLPGALAFGLFLSAAFGCFAEVAASAAFAPLFGAAGRGFSPFACEAWPLTAAFAGAFGFSAFAGLAVLAALTAATAFPFNGFPVAGFFAGGWAALFLVLPEDLPDLGAGRLERCGGLFGTLLRTAVLPVFFPFTLGISQPFRTPGKMEWRNIAAQPPFRQTFSPSALTAGAAAAAAGRGGRAHAGSADLFGQSLPEPLGDGLDLAAVGPLDHDAHQVLGP